MHSILMSILLTSDLCNKMKPLVIMFSSSSARTHTHNHMQAHTHTYALTGVTLKQELFPMHIGSRLWRGNGGLIRTGEER